MSKQFDNLFNVLKDYDKPLVEKYVNYCNFLATEKKKDGSLKNTWMKYKDINTLADHFKTVNNEGLVFDGKHITLQSTGISYDYQAYKNKMLIAYPKTIIDIDLVYKNDVFEFSKQSGIVTYTHDISDPFGRVDGDIIGGYCVIKNKRGQFLTTLTKAEIEKHRKVAKTDYIWRDWYVEMCRKTIIKKACSSHFNDIYSNINNSDNENYDIENDIDIELSVKQKIENIMSIEDLTKFYHDNKDKHKANADGFNKMLSKRKKAILEEAKNDNS